MFETLTGDVQGPLEVKGAVKIQGTLHGGAVVTGSLELDGTCLGPIEVRLDGHADVLVAVGTVLNGRQLLPDGSFVPLAGPGEYRIPRDAGMLRPTENGLWAPAE
jgi:hypothetical protein